MSLIYLPEDRTEFKIKANLLLMPEYEEDDVGVRVGDLSEEALEEVNNQYEEVFGEPLADLADKTEVIESNGSYRFHVDGEDEVLVYELEQGSMPTVSVKMLDRIDSGF